MKRGKNLSNEFKSGFVSIVGRPNVGKSTLMNNLVGEKLSIISAKPQTTRNKIQTVLTKEDYQIIFLDTPGMHKSRTKLGDYMNKSANNTLNEVDVLLYLIEPTEIITSKDRDILARFENVDTPIFLVINKIDTIEKNKILKIIQNYTSIYDFKEIIPISALKDENIDGLLQSIKNKLPVGPKYFPDDTITDQPERQIVSELIREKALFLLQDEIPHGIAVEIMSMKKRNGSDLIDIEANIYCEKESHKGIVIGKDGKVLKSIGTKARRDIENLLGHKIYLQLWVKVKKEWRDNNTLLKSFGYDTKGM
jgi:GTPase